MQLLEQISDTAGVTAVREKPARWSSGSGCVRELVPRSAVSGERDQVVTVIQNRQVKPAHAAGGRRVLTAKSRGRVCVDGFVTDESRIFSRSGAVGDRVGLPLAVDTRKATSNGDRSVIAGIDQLRASWLKRGIVLHGWGDIALAANATDQGLCISLGSVIFAGVKTAAV